MDSYPITVPRKGRFECRLPLGDTTDDGTGVIEGSAPDGAVITKSDELTEQTPMPARTDAGSTASAEPGSAPQAPSATTSTSSPSSAASLETDTVSIISWNVLADSLLTKNVQEYAHIPQEWKTWSTRLAGIVTELTTADADIICLQEVEFSAFAGDFSTALGAAGYDGRMQNDKKKAATHCQGVATFWKRGKFQVVAQASRSRTLAVVLQDSAGRRVAVCNVHLEGHPRKSVARLKQLQNTLRDVSTK